MSEINHIIIPALFAFLGTLWIHPKILKIAIMKNLVDNPDARKLQRNPVPVMGGMAVFFGIVIGLCCSQTMFNSPAVFMLTAAMMIMLYIGTIDDIMDLTPTIRFVIEILIDIGCQLFLVKRNYRPGISCNAGISHRLNHALKLILQECNSQISCRDRKALITDSQFHGVAIHFLVKNGFGIL